MKKVLVSILIFSTVLLSFFLFKDKQNIPPKIISEKASHKYYDENISYPDTESDFMEVVDYIFSQKNEFEGGVKNLDTDQIKLLESDPSFRYQIFIDTKVATSSNTISFIVNTYTFEGGAHGMSKVKTFVYKNKKLLKPSDIFVNSSWKNTISNMAREYFKVELGNYLDEQMLENGVVANDDNFNDFYFSGDSIVFVFQEYSIGPFALGIQEFKVKFSNIKNLLKDKNLSSAIYSDFTNDYSVFIGENTYTVSKVVDGDTIEVLINGQKEKIRLIGVNTPETVDPRKKVECFGKEASSFLKNLLSGKKVSLVSDESQGEKDKYGRLLRYVYLDGLFVNKEIIEKGFGYEYTYHLPYKYQKDFKEAQQKAKDNSLGLWKDGVCN